MATCVKLIGFIQKKNKLLFMTRSSFVTWSESPVDVRLFPSHRDWVVGALSSPETVPKSLRKTFLGLKADKSLFSFRKICRHFKETEITYNYKFSKINALRIGSGRKSLPQFSTGRIKPLIFPSSLPLQGA